MMMSMCSEKKNVCCYWFLVFDDEFLRTLASELFFFEGKFGVFVLDCSLKQVCHLVVLVLTIQFCRLCRPVVQV